MTVGAAPESRRATPREPVEPREDGRQRRKRIRVSAIARLRRRRISSRSPTQPDPRRRRASSRRRGGGEEAQRQVDGFALGSQPIAAHDGGAGIVVDIHVGA